MRLMLFVLMSACASTPVVRPAATATGDTCGISETPSDVPEVSTVDGPTARRLVEQGARLVDVRAPDYYARGHIDGAINIPVAVVAERAAAGIGPAETPVVLYCRTGKGSAAAARTLARLGYSRVYDLGSYLNWGDGAPPATPLNP
jgi:rhodanese-related sulfurtransferase